MRIGQVNRHASESTKQGASEHGLANPVVSLNALTHRYSNGQLALNNVTFAIHTGECVAIVGPNGAGKTTLFLRLCGIFTGQPGQVRICGLDPAMSDERSRLPESVGIVFQNPDDQLFSPTVLDDVAFGPLNLGETVEVAHLRARESLAAVGLGEIGERAPFQLSGGDKRRVALAGVLAMQPAVLLLDEPTAFLDPRGRRDLIRLIQQLPGTKLIATHDLDLVLDLCSRVIVLDAGRVFADGPTDQVLANSVLMDAHGLEVPYRLRRLGQNLQSLPASNIAQ
jgi:energy-coupling factor transporter ATP-binding protein EcfA2